MIESSQRPVVDFTPYITDQTHDFTGREWLFQQINNWMADRKGSRIFLLTGEPGSGKTAIASRIAQFTLGTVIPPDGLSYLFQNSIHAFYFCSALPNNRYWIDPQIFTKSLAVQLANHHAPFASALASSNSNTQNITIATQQHTGDASHVVGVNIHNLQLFSGESNENIFNRLIRLPLEAIYSESSDEQIIILVDALDEALSYTSEYTNVVSLLSQLRALPHVRLLLTSRQDTRVERLFPEADGIVLSADYYQHQNNEDIQQFVKKHFPTELALNKRTTTQPDEWETVVSTITGKSEGNFLYTRFLLNAFISGQRGTADVTGLPQGLSALYSDSFDRVVSIGKKVWSRDYAPLLGVLAVAQESLTVNQIQALAQLPEQSVWEILNDLQQFLEETSEDTGEPKDTRYRLYHSSIIDFLHSPLIPTKGRSLINLFHLSMQEWHEKVVHICELGHLDNTWKDDNLDAVEQARREYARLYYITHLYMSKKWQQLFAVLDEGAYGRAKVLYDPSARLYVNDLDLGRAAAAWDGWKLQEQLDLLPHLWRYTLLRCSLTSRADRYPPEAFMLLAVLKREKEALNIANSLTNPIHKAEALILIANSLDQQAKHSIEILIRAKDIIADLAFASLEQQTQILYKLATGFVQHQCWEEAEAIGLLLGNIHHPDAVELLCLLLQRFLNAQQIKGLHTLNKRVETLIGAAIKSIAPFEYAIALCKFGKFLVQAQLPEQAHGILNAVPSLVNDLEDIYQRSEALRELGKALAQAQLSERALSVWANVEQLISSGDFSKYLYGDYLKVEALLKLGVAFAQTQSLEQAQRVWGEALKMVETLQGGFRNGYFWQRNTGLVEDVFGRDQLENVREPGDALAQIDNTAIWLAGNQNGFVVWSGIDKKVEALLRIGQAFANVQLWDKAIQIWNRALRKAQSLETSWSKVWTLRELARAFIQAQLWEKAESIQDEANDLIIIAKELNELHALEQDVYTEMESPWNQRRSQYITQDGKSEHSNFIVYDKQGVAKFQIHNEESTEIQGTRDDLYSQQVILFYELGLALFKGGQPQQAQAVWQQAIEQARLIEKHTSIMQEIGIAFAHIQQWKYAQTLIDMIKKHDQKARALCTLGLLASKNRQRTIARDAWSEAEACLWVPVENDGTATSLYELGSALLQVKQEQQAVALWEKARNARCTNQERSDVVTTLLKLGSTLQQDKQELAAQKVWEEAATVAGMVQNDFNGFHNTRKETLINLIDTLLNAKEFSRVLDIAETSESDEFKDWIYGSLSVALATLQEWDASYIAALGTSVSRLRVNALVELGIHLEATNQREYALRMWEEAEIVLHKLELEETVNINEVRSKLLFALVSAKHWKRAKSLVSRVKDIYARFGGLCTIGQGYIEDKQIHQARGILQKAWKLAHKLTGDISPDMVSPWMHRDIDMRIYALCGLTTLIATNTSKHLPNTQALWHDTIMTAQSLDAEKRDTAFAEISISLADLQEWDRAWEAIHSINDTEVMIETLYKLGIVFTQHQQWEQIHKLLNELQTKAHLENQQQKDEFFLSISYAFAAAQLWNDAERTVLEIAEESQKVAALARIGSTYLSHFRLEHARSIWEKAENIAYRIEVDEPLLTWWASTRGKRVRVLRALVDEISQAFKKQFSDTEIHRSYQNQDVDEVVTKKENPISLELCDVLVKIVRNAWSRADTRRYAVELLPLANKLTILTPPLGIALYDTFDWVTKFLESFIQTDRGIKNQTANYKDAWQPLSSKSKEQRQRLVSLSNTDYPHKFNGIRARIYLRQTEIDVLSGNIHQGLEDVQRALEIFPEYVPAYKMRGDILLDTAQYEEALRAYDYAIQRCHNNLALKLDLYSRRGVGYVLLEKYQSAIEDFDYVILLEPENSFAFNNRGYTYSLLGEYNKAISDYNDAIRLNPMHNCFYGNRANAHTNSQAYTKAIQDYTYMLDLFKQSDLIFDSYRHDMRYIHLRPKNGDVYYQRGELYSIVGEFQLAIKDFSSALRHEPNNPWLLAGRGENYYILSKYQDAFKDLNKAINLTPNEPTFYFIRSTIYLDIEDYQKALYDLNRAIALAPTYVEAYVRRAVIYHHFRDYQTALKDIAQALSLDTRHAQAFAIRGDIYEEQENYENALVDFNYALAYDPSAESYRRRGYIYRLLENYEQALSDFDQAIALDEQDAWIFAERGATKALLGQYEKALEDFNQALRLNQNYAWALTERGFVHLELDNNANALSDFNNAIECDPTYSLAYMGQSVVLVRLQRYSEAIEICTQLLAHNDLGPIIYRQRALLYQELKNYKEALLDYTHYLELETTDGSGYRRRGEVHYELGLYELAIADYTRALEMGEDSEEIYIHRAQTYIASKDYPLALEDLDRAQALNGNSTWVFLYRGWIFAYSKDYQQALIELNHALELDPDEGWAYFQHGYINLWQKDLKQAKVDFLKAQQLAPKEVQMYWMVAFVEICHQKPGLEIVEQLETIIQADTHSHIAHLCLALIHWFQGNSEQALDEAEQALLIDANSSDTYFWKGMICATLEKYEEAITAIHQALEEELPPILLTPLHWLKQNHQGFYEHYIVPLLEENR